MNNDSDKLSWEDLIKKKSEEDPSLKSFACKVFNHQSRHPTDQDKLCPCHRLVRRHSYTGKCIYPNENVEKDNTWKDLTTFSQFYHRDEIPINVCGILQSTGCKFLRISEKVTGEKLFRLILEDCKQQRPALILSVSGGAKFFTMTERLEKEFIRGIIDAATMAGAWILTNGISNGVSKVVGEGIAHNRLLREHSDRVKCIGLTMWGTINEDSRIEMKEASRNYSPKPCRRQIPDSLQDDNASIERNHTHCLLLDSGQLKGYLDDNRRTAFVKAACEYEDGEHTCDAVTIIVEGGLGSLEVIRNDIDANRPIVLIRGSGRLADVLATLVEQTSDIEGNQYWDPSSEEINQAYHRFFFNLSNEDLPSYIRKDITKILKKEKRYLFHVFSLDRDKNVAETIFQAIFKAKNKKNRNQNEQKDQRDKDQDKLVDLALDWNYFDGALPILQAQQVEMVEKDKDSIKKDINRQKELFRKSLENNRPKFIDYFLSGGFDPVTLVQNDQKYDKFICDLYNKSCSAMDTAHQERVNSLFGSSDFKAIEHLDHKLNELVGSFFELIYKKNDHHMLKRIRIDLSSRSFSCCKLYNELSSSETADKSESEESKYTKHQMIRDLLLWSIFMDMPEMSKVLLLHSRSRICGALIASAVFKKYARLSKSADIQDKFCIQSLEFETYAARSIEKCYEYNENRGCELLLRQNPLFGNVTCMQVAISSESRKLLETACFDQALDQVWYNKLSLINHQSSQKVLLMPSIFTLGLIAPWIVTYRKEQEKNQSLSEGSTHESLSRKGINYYMNKLNPNEAKATIYCKKFIYFHQSPLVKMVYHFLSYILFLLIFSYMMLYQLDGRNKFEIPHWTEIYVIITVSTMFCEEVRKLYHDYKTYMLERWGSTGSSLLTVLTNLFYILPYFLFYLGLAFRYQSFNVGLLSTTRIIWALDLNLWYLGSLKFVIALKFLGPKLFMLKNMLRDLFAFLYMMFIAVAAYGVVSRSLILYKQVPFTGHGIFGKIFFEPYWFIYGEVSDKVLIDGIMSNDTDTRGAEAMATHVILALHMLFINILLLNLLIAVFTDTIAKVQENTEFYWRYQRYSFVRQYFERLPLSYPPLIAIPHLILFFLTIYRKSCAKLCGNRQENINKTPDPKSLAPIFKMIPMKDSVNEKWDAFENAATHSYARSTIEKHKDEDLSSTDSRKSARARMDNESDPTTSTDAEETAAPDLKDELRKVVLEEIQRGLEQHQSRTDSRLDQMTTSIESMMNVLTRMNMNDPTHSKPTSDSVV